jgi:hypothetical protein
VASWGHLEPSWGHLRPSWAVLGCLGDILGPSWAAWGLAWDHLGGIFGHLGVILGHLGVMLAILGYLGPSWNQLSHRGASWPSWGAILRPSWEHVGATLGLVRLTLGGAWVVSSDVRNLNVSCGKNMFFEGPQKLSGLNRGLNRGLGKLGSMCCDPDA